MLYDPKWEKIYTTAGLSAWLAKQPKDKHYSFVDTDNCAAAQYLRAQGVDHNISCDRLDELGWMDVVCTGPYNTFGHAARRARLIQRGGWCLRLARFFGVSGLCQE